jgi:hypothetical protein
MWKTFPTESEQDREFLWRHALIRKALLEDDIPAFDTLKEHYLEQNHFEGSALCNKALGFQESELNDVNQALAKLEREYGPPSQEILDAVQKRLEELEQQFGEDL